MILSTIRNALAAIHPEKIFETDYARKGFSLDVTVSADRIEEAVAVVDQNGFFIETITGVDWLGEKAAQQKEAAAKVAEKADAGAEDAATGKDEPLAPGAGNQVEPLVDDMEVIYDFNHYSDFCRVVIRVRIPRNAPKLKTISKIYPAALWHERETHDFFGIKFTGHPYLVPLLLPEDADFHPLLKDFNK